MTKVPAVRVGEGRAKGFNPSLATSWGWKGNDPVASLFMSARVDVR
jgi:hypothetical protein